MSNAIGIDLGGTRIKAVAIDPEGNILKQLYKQTNDGNDKIWKQAVIDSVWELQKELTGRAHYIGISAPGLPSEDNTAISYMPGRLNGLENLNWSDQLDNEVFVINDAIAALIAEAKYGVARSRKNVVLITLGTGVGGAIMIDGKPYQGAFNKAGHIGHMVINEEGAADSTGMPGSLEDCIGNSTIQQRSAGKFNSTFELLEAFKNDDSLAKEVWLKSVNQLAIGLASITNIISPEMIVIGGGIAEADDNLFGPLREYMAKYEWCPNGGGVEIVKAKHGDLAGAIGAASFAMSK